MDQDSSNGTGPDKRNWRERLGIGAKELPKLSDEFRGEPQMTSQPAPPAGEQRFTLRVTAPGAYPGEATLVNGVITLLPFFKHGLKLSFTE